MALPTKIQSSTIPAKLIKLNLITAIPDTTIKEWSSAIERVYPDLLDYELNDAVDRLISGKVEWNSFIGIQNITKIIASIRTTRVNTKDFY